MALKPFSDNFTDNSTHSGFQFTFYCDICKEGYKTEFMPSKSSKRTGLIRVFTGLFSAVTSLFGRYRSGYAVRRGGNAIGGTHTGRSAKWHKEHETAFEVGQNEAKKHFHRCPKCTKWVCENDWNEQEGLCTQDAPRVNIEVAAARAGKAVDDIRSKAQKTQVFDGEIESKQTLCPACNKPAGEGKFCNNCGASLEMLKCPKCGAENPFGTGFCGSCGQKLA